MVYPVLGLLLADKDTYPKLPPGLAENIGWLCFGVMVLIMLWAWLRAESVRRAALALEDPRMWAVTRIGFAVMTAVCFINLFPYWNMLWSDEGIFNLAYAQDRLGRTALRGWSPEEGFFDVWAVVCFLWNKPSFFYTQGSPTFVAGYMAAFFVVLALYGAGVFTRVTGVIAWLMMSSVYNRNALYWEGTDTVYRCFWFILIFAKAGHAWSFDNWWRCRRLRRKGLLEEPGQDPPEPGGRRREPIYRLVPSWPRYLFMLQLSALYLTTGAVKTGSVWTAGDALYYALNMDHFYRFEDATQVVSSVFGMNLFRVMTWVTHWWERLFPLVLIGVVLRFSYRHRHEPWYQAQNTRWRIWLGRAALLGAYAAIARIVELALPYCLAMKDDTPQDPAPVLLKMRIAFYVVVPLWTMAWYALRRWPVSLWSGGRSLGKLTARWPWVRLPHVVIDHERLRRWTLGRRLWLPLGFIFHGFLALFMNIGMFPLIMLMTYIGFVRGEEVVAYVRWVVAGIRRTSLARHLPKRVDQWLVDAEPPTHVPVRGRRIPDPLILLLGLAGVGLIYGKVDKAEWVGTATYAWLGTTAAVALLFRLLPPRAIDRTRAREPGPALMGGAVVRTFVLLAMTWHSCAVAVHLFPSYAAFSKWRTPVRGIFSGWLRGAGATQSWRMFAPNPPRSNTFMRTVVVVENGEGWDLRNNAWEDRPNPWIINDRMRKMQRRMVGKGKWYLRYWAEYQCRQWALAHQGEHPVEIRISKYVTSIPKPAWVSYWRPAKLKGRKDKRTGAISGQPYVPRELKMREDDVQTHKCKADGRLPVFMKERYGLPVTEDDRHRADKEQARHDRKFNKRRETWEKRKDYGRWFAAKAEQQQRDQAARERRARQLRPSKKDAESTPHEPNNP